MSWDMYLYGVTLGYVDENGVLVYDYCWNTCLPRDEVGCSQLLEIKKEFGWWQNCFFLSKMFFHRARQNYSDFSENGVYLSRCRMRRIIRICEKILNLQFAGSVPEKIPRDVVLNDKALAFSRKVFLRDVKDGYDTHQKILDEIKRTVAFFKRALECAKDVYWDFEITSD